MFARLQSERRTKVNLVESLPAEQVEHSAAIQDLAEAVWLAEAHFRSWLAGWLAVIVVVVVVVCSRA